MNTWLFSAYALAFSAAVYAHFVLAYRAWKRSQGEEPSEIDPNYVRLEDYFARSFRAKVSDWLLLATRSAMPDGTRILRKGREQVRVSGPLEYEPQTRSDEILVVQGTFRARAGCVFKREIYVSKDAEIGPATRLQAIATDGDLKLGQGVRVIRWADCLGDMMIGANTIVQSRATAGKRVWLEDGAQVGSVFASTIFTPGASDEKPDGAKEQLRQAQEVSVLAAPSGLAGLSGANELERERLTMLSSDCWLYSGDLKPAAPLRIKTKLVVKGNCDLPAGSLVEGDIKARKDLKIGRGSVCLGNVIAGGDISFQESSRFHGVVHAGGTLRLASGVRGGVDGAKVAAFAADVAVLEDGVVIHGKVAAANRVIVRVPASR